MLRADSRSSFISATNTSLEALQATHNRAGGNTDAPVASLLGAALIANSRVGQIAAQLPNWPEKPALVDSREGLAAVPAPGLAHTALSEQLVGSVPVHEKGERLVDLEALAHLRGVKLWVRDSEGVGAVYLRESMASAVIGAAKDLLDATGEMVTLFVNSGLRPRAKQEQYWNEQRETSTRQLKEQGITPDSAEDFAAQLYEHMTRFVADPEFAPHLTGGAVDLTLAWGGAPKDGTNAPELLEMGSPINSVKDEDRPQTFTSELTPEAAYNRLLLHAALSGRGLRNHPWEYWHNEMGTRLAAAYSGEETARFGPLADLSRDDSGGKPATIRSLSQEFLAPWRGAERKIGELDQRAVDETRLGEIAAEREQVAARIDAFLQSDNLVLPMSKDKATIGGKELGPEFQKAAKALLLEFEDYCARRGVGELDDRTRKFCYRLLACDLYTNCSALEVMPGAALEAGFFTDRLRALVVVLPNKFGDGTPAPLTDIMAAEPTAPGCALITFKNGQIIDARAFGASENGLNGAPIGLDTCFDIASLSKAFTAFMVLRLSQAGVLSFDDPLSKYVPELASRYPHVTLEHLVRQTSGIPEILTLIEDHRAELEPKGIREVGLTNAMTIGVLKDYGAPLFEPGEQPHYSNSNYELLATVIERATGRPFHQVFNEIFEPFGLSRTYVRGHAPPEITQVIGYRLDGERGLVSASAEVSDTVGDGHVYSTLRDLTTWYQALIGSSSITADERALIFSVGTTTDFKTVPYGLGWFQQPTESSVRFHTGFDDCYGISVLGLGNGLSIVFLTNNREKSDDGRTVARAIYRAATSGRDVGPLTDF